MQVFSVIRSKQHLKKTIIILTYLTASLKNSIEKSSSAAVETVLIVFCAVSSITPATL